MSIVLISLALCLFVNVIPSCTYIVYSAQWHESGIAHME